MKEGFMSVVVVDFGSQLGHLIARRVRELGIYAEVVPYDTPLAKITARKPRGIILSGGPRATYGAEALTISDSVYQLGIPILGICYGAQLMAVQLGGAIELGAVGEYGRTVLTTCGMRATRILPPEADTLEVWMSHADDIAVQPPGFEVTSRSENGQVRDLYGVQFHPEVVHTPQGLEMLRRFLVEICGCDASWRADAILTEAVEYVRGRVGKERVVCALSGGIDSAVTAAILHRAVPQQTAFVFIDTGLMRKSESEMVSAEFAEWFGQPLRIVDASRHFYGKLAGVSDPERKRKIIGETFVREFEKVADENGATFLAQGTIYPDRIESGIGPSDVIKSHHNVGGIPPDIRLSLVEPLRDLYKDEVRDLALLLGMPLSLIRRHPFPGPGLAIRVLGEVTPENVAILREADAILIEELQAAGLYDGLWQAFVILLPLRTVGVMGDRRTYEYPVAIRVITSKDAMTANWARLPYDFLDRVARRIVGGVRGINRVVLDITSKPPATIGWE
jgi:GMP synthase (glutamine-hydrolysing)